MLIGCVLHKTQIEALFLGQRKNLQLFRNYAQTSHEYSSPVLENTW